MKDEPAEPRVFFVKGDPKEGPMWWRFVPTEKDSDFKVIEFSAYERLQKILRQEASDNDELGSEFVLVQLLKEENQKLKEALQKIATTEYLAYRQGDTPSDHQYKLGVTDGHRLAAEWAKEALK